MKNFMALCFLVLSFNVFANSEVGTTIEVPYPQQEAYLGSISRVEPGVKKKLMDKAIAVCKTKENISAIAEVEVKISFEVIELGKGYEVGSDQFEGLYPLAAASAVVYCKQ